MAAIYYEIMMNPERIVLDTGETLREIQIDDPLFDERLNTMLETLRRAILRDKKKGLHLGG